MVSRKDISEAQRFVKENKKACLLNLCEQIHKKVQDNNGRMPHKFMKTLVEENKKSFNWLTRDMINSSYTRFKKRKRMDEMPGKEQPAIFKIRIEKQDSDKSKSTLHSTSISDLTCNTLNNTNERDSNLTTGSREKGGRPSGTTNVNKRRVEQRIIEMKNDIAQEYKIEHDKLKKEGKKLKPGQLKEMIENHKKRNNLMDVNIPEVTIRMRAQRHTSVIHHTNHGGLQSPLVEIDEDIVKIILMMARIRQCLTPSTGLALVNSLIDKQPIQQKLIAWKKKFSSNDTGTVGYKYWNGFMKRNKYRLVSRRGQKYSLDRQNWTTYHNFSDMYEHTYEEMVSSGVAEKLTNPIWLDKEGNECDEDESFGCKVNYKLIHPNQCFVGDEVGGNISMKGDGHVGGRKLLTAPDSIAYDRVSVSDKRFTLIGLTALDGSPVMCILILQGKRKDLSVETGIDIRVKPEGDPNNGDTYFFMNSGPGKYFPGPPTCQFRGREIPALVRWNDSGSITSEILVEALSTLDVMNIVDRDENKKPFLLLDGHGSRLEMPFLKYINTPEDHWVVCLGVPYGTALWQVGDSKEQNGSFNMAFSKAKQELLNFKIQKMSQDCSLKPTDLIPLINIAWGKSFARVEQNKKAIAERGWNPLNYNLLTNSDLRATMTVAERLTESSKITLPPSFRNTAVDSNPNSTSTSTSTSNSNSQSDSELSSSSTSNHTNHNENPSVCNETQQSSLNFSTGVSAECLTALVRTEQLMEARERIKREKAEGEDLATRLKGGRKITAGFCWKEGTNRLGKTVFEVCKEKLVQKKNEEMKKKNKEEKAYLDLKEKADTILSSGKEIGKMSNKELSIILKSLKRNGDTRIPTKKTDMIQLYEEWKGRPPLVFDHHKESNDIIDNNNDNATETDTDCDENNSINVVMI